MRKKLIGSKVLDPKKIIKPNQLSKILEKIKGIKYLNLSSGYGEPFLNPHLSELVKMANEEGFKVILFTNATINNNYKEIISNCHKILISLDYADKEKYLSKRKGANYEKILTNILELTRYEKYNSKIILSKIFFPEDTLEDLYQLSNFCVNTKIKTLELRDKYPLDFNKNLLRKISQKDIHILRKTFPSLNIVVPTRKKTLSCPEIENSLYMDISGNLKYCCFFPYSEIGDNINQIDLSDLMSNKKLNLIKKNSRRGKFPSHCKDCPILRYS